MESKLAKSYLKELEAEYTATRKCLERIPESVADFKPHPKSMAMGYLSQLTAEIPLWIAIMVEEGEIDFVKFQHASLSQSYNLVQHFEENIQRAKTALANATDEDLDAIFELKSDGQLIYSSTKHENISSTLNHWVHHRGQLTVYMRLNDIEVPSIYGPSADDRGF